MSMTRKSIILVDDVNFHLLSTKERLKKYYDIYPAQSAEALFELLTQTRPDLILLDVNMPGSDGFETLKKLKADERYSAIPVIFLSSKNDKKSVIQGMKCGAYDFITKPYNDADMIACIESLFDPTKRDANKPVILAVDDNPSMLKSIYFLLGNKYRVYTLPEPEKIKELLKMVTPDLFLLDCNMPVLNGFDLVPIIREIPAHDDTPIIFLTAEGSVDNLSVAVHLGASDFLVKPVDENLLHEKVSLNLENYMIRRRIRSLDKVVM